MTSTALVPISRVNGTLTVPTKDPSATRTETATEAAKKTTDELRSMSFRREVRPAEEYGREALAALKKLSVKILATGIGLVPVGLVKAENFFRAAKEWFSKKKDAIVEKYNEKRADILQKASTSVWRDTVDKIKESALPKEKKIELTKRARDVVAALKTTFLIAKEDGKVDSLERKKMFAKFYDGMTNLSRDVAACIRAEANRVREEERIQRSEAKYASQERRLAEQLRQLQERREMQKKEDAETAKAVAARLDPSRYRRS